MAVTSRIWSRPLQKLPLALSIFGGLYLFCFLMVCLVLSAIFQGIETQRASGLERHGPGAVDNSCRLTNPLKGS